MASTYLKKPYLCKRNRQIRMIAGKLLRYFIPIILLTAVAFAVNAENNDSTAAECQPYALAAELDYHNWETSLSHTDLHLPCQMSAANVFRLQSTGKRTGKAYKSVCQAFSQTDKSWQTHHLARQYNHKLMRQCLLLFRTMPHTACCICKHQTKPLNDSVGCMGTANRE